MSLRHPVLPFNLELTDTPDLVTSRAALPAVVELMRVLYRCSWYKRLANALDYGHWKTVSRHLESLVLLVIDGGEHLSDLEYLRADAALPKLLGFEISSASQATDFPFRGRSLALPGRRGTSSIGFTRLPMETH